MHLHIFRDEFSRLNRENFHCFAMKSLVKIYANACICIYFKRADSSSYDENNFSDSSLETSSKNSKNNDYSENESESESDDE